MFDRIIVNKSEQRDRLVPYEKEVREYRAPTDESIKLYKEMEEKAYKNIQAAWKINNNGLEISIARICCPEFPGYQFSVYFVLNGKRHYLKVLGVGAIRSTIEDEIQKIKKELSEYIANKFLLEIKCIKGL
jgi:hypothetical protein